MAKTAKCYMCNTVLSVRDYDPDLDALVCKVCTMPDPDHPDTEIPTRNILEPVDYIDMGITKKVNNG